MRQFIGQESRSTTFFAFGWILVLDLVAICNSWQWVTSIHCLIFKDYRTKNIWEILKTSKHQQQVERELFCNNKFNSQRERRAAGAAYIQQKLWTYFCTVFGNCWWKLVLERRASRRSFLSNKITMKRWLWPQSWLYR